MSYDPWACRCGHEFAIENAGTPNARQVPHDCPRLPRPAGKVCAVCGDKMPSFRVNTVCEDCHREERERFGSDNTQED